MTGCDDAMSGDLKWNKIFGAGLATALVIVGVREITTVIYKPHPPAKMGYFVNAPEASEGAGAAEAALPIDWGTVLPTADLAAGEQAFARCQACHTINAGGANGIGPNLYSIVGNRVLHAAGFAYSDAMSAYATSTPNWTYDALDAFIKSPQRTVSGTKMSFAGLRDDATRINLIAYLRNQGSAGYAIPAPDPARQPGAAAAAGAAPVTDPNSATAAQPPGEAMGADAPVSGPAAAPTAQATMPAQPAANQAPSPQAAGPR